MLARELLIKFQMSREPPIGRPEKGLREILTVTPEQIARFHADGFLILDRFLDPELIEAARDRFEPLFRGQFETGLHPDEWNWREGRDPADLTRQICNGWKSDLAIARIVLAETVGRACAALMGWHGARLAQDNVIWKPPGAKPLGFHQDDSYCHWVVPAGYCTCWMALDETSAAGGTIEMRAARTAGRWPRRSAASTRRTTIAKTSARPRCGLATRPRLSRWRCRPAGPPFIMAAPGTVPIATAATGRGGRWSATASMAWPGSTQPRSAMSTTATNGSATRPWTRASPNSVEDWRGQDCLAEPVTEGGCLCGAVRYSSGRMAPLRRIVLDIAASAAAGMVIGTAPTPLSRRRPCSSSPPPTSLGTARPKRPSEASAAPAVPACSGVPTGATTSRSPPARSTTARA